MKRIIIVGNPGSGKSTLARRVGLRLDLPVFHLDKHYWSAGWVMPDKHAFQVEVAEIAAREAWVIDGNYWGTSKGSRLARADTLIHLDFSTWRAFWNVGKRVVTSYGKVRPDMAEGCPEQFSAEFVAYIWRYRRSKRPQLVADLDDFGGKRLDFTTHAAVDTWLNSL